MQETVQKLLDPVKGVLAADESTGTITKRFAALGLTSDPELNRKYRQLLFTTNGIEGYLSGIIMYDETVRQKTDNGIPFPEYLAQKGIAPGIKVDGGLEPFNNTEEQITKGLDGLGDRLREYSGMGLKFTKWRAVFKITDYYPSDAFLEEDLNRLTEFAKISQDNGFVPFVEPEILLDGTHTTTRCEEIETKVLKILFEKIRAKGVDFKNLILKTSMVLPGIDSTVKAAPLEVAQATLRTLRNSVPGDVPGILFLSGGQTPDEATKNLNEINIAAHDEKFKANYPWQLSFSFARALQEEAMTAWVGKDENIAKAQELFLERAKKVSLARQGLLS